MQKASSGPDRGNLHLRFDVGECGAHGESPALPLYGLGTAVGGATFTGMTRREIMLATPAALMAQAPPLAEIPQNSEDELKAAIEQNRRNAEQLAKIAVPMTVEPAVHFKA